MPIFFKFHKTLSLSLLIFIFRIYSYKNCRLKIEEQVQINDSSIMEPTFKQLA